MKQPEAIAKRYVLYFNESLRGLSVGAPVTLLGLPMGEVASVGWDLAPGTSVLRGRVEIVAFPERLVALLDPAQAAAGEAILSTARKRHALVERLVEDQGLRGQLRSGNLLTGQLYVAFDFFPDAPRAKVDWSQDMPEVPTVESTLPDLEAKLSSIMAKIDQIPFAAIGADLKKSIEALDQTLDAIDKAVMHIDKDVTPALKPAIVEFRRAMASADRVLKDTDATLLGKDAPGQQELRDALREVSSAARAVRVLSDLLERHPEALLRGKTGDK